MIRPGSPARLLSALAVATLAVLPLQAGSSTADPIVYTSDSTVQTWDPIYPASADPNWPSTVCTATPQVGPDADWVNPSVGQRGQRVVKRLEERRSDLRAGARQDCVLRREAER